MMQVWYGILEFNVPLDTVLYRVIITVRKVVKS